MRALYSTIAAFFVLLVANSSHAKTDAHYSRTWCAAHSGIHQKTLVDRTRADCVTDDYAVEIEFARKYYEGVGQALHYSTVAEKKAGLVIVIESDSDEKYYDRVVNMIEYHKLPIKLWKLDERNIEAPQTAPEQRDLVETENAAAAPQAAPPEVQGEVEADTFQPAAHEPSDKTATQELLTHDQLLDRLSKPGALLPKYFEGISKSCENASDRTCKTVGSCRQALYDMYVCGETSRDGNDDGVPCQKLCVNSFDRVRELLTDQ